MKKQKGLIIIPAYNEAKVIKDVYRQIRDESNKISLFETDIVVVNDGSSDDTERIVDRLTTTINHYVNMGSGAATRTGLAYAKQQNYDFAVTIDADGQHSPKDLMNVVDVLVKSNYDLVIGSRLLNTKGMPVVRVIGNKILNFATRIILGVSVTDSQSGLKAFSKKAINSIEIRSNGFEFCSEIIWRAKQQNLRIKEIPIKAIYTDYSRAKGQSNINALRIMKNLIRQKMREV